MNLLKAIFLFKFVNVTFGGITINFLERFVPNVFKRLYLHGRFNDSVRNAYMEKLEVPKRWFKHFYLFAAPYSTLYLGLLLYRYLLGGTLPRLVTWQLHLFLSDDEEQSRSTPVSAERALLVMMIFTLHCWKRFYESHYISVFSDSSMSFSIYLIGFFHYFGSVLSIVGESRDIDRDLHVDLSWSKLTWLEYAFAFIFMLSTWLQFRTNVILSRLRRDEQGTVITKQHKIPRGELFEYITAPLQFLEIILYLSISCILREGASFHYVTLWTLANQLECAYLAHKWAVKKFENYPKSRKIIVPFVL